MDNENTANRANQLTTDANAQSTSGGAASSSETAFDVASARALFAKAYPDAVPELITGSSLAEMEASLPVAQQAFARIRDQVAGAGAAGSAASAAGAPGAQTQTAPHVPAGSPPNTAATYTDIDKLPPTELIKRGIEARNRSQHR
jgi:hypothetical protein